MKNLKIALLMLVTLSIVTWSCKKDEPDPTPTPTPTNQTCYYSKIDYGSYYMLAEYNTSNQLIKMTDYDSTGVPEDYYTEIEYAGGKIKAINSYQSNSLDSKFEFYYGANTTPDSLILYGDDGSGSMERQGAFSLTFNADQLVKAEMSYVIMGFPVVISKIEIAYSGKNVSSVKNYALDMTTFQLKLNGTTEYAYDAKKNPNYNIGLNYLVLLDASFGSENNPTKITEKDENNAVMQDASENITYTYSTNNYPTKSVATAFDNSYTETIIYTYNCK